MKLKGLFICMCLFLLCSGCSSTDTLNEDLATNLSEDIFVKDFYLDNEKYELPCSVQKFLDHGWQPTEETVTLSEVNLKNRYYIEITLEKQNTELLLQVMNDTDHEVSLLSDDALVQYAEIYMDHETPLPIVFKGGISEETSEKTVKKVMKELNTKNPEVDSDDISEDALLGEDGYTTILDFNYSNHELNHIKIGDEAKHLDYREYENEEVATGAIADKKKKIEADSEKNAEGNYNLLVEILNKGEYTGIHKNLKIVEAILTSAYNLDIATGSGYIAEDQNGKLYAIKSATSNADYITWPDFQVDDNIEVWGVSYELLNMNDEDETMVPYIRADIIEKDGELVYRSK